jgi:hypothetical protein
LGSECHKEPEIGIDEKIDFNDFSDSAAMLWADAYTETFTLTGGAKSLPRHG